MQAPNAVPYDKEKGPRDASWAVSMFFHVYFDFLLTKFLGVIQDGDTTAEEDQDRAGNDHGEHNEDQQ